jgi:hypothetical protein
MGGSSPWVVRVIGSGGKSRPAAGGLKGRRRGQDNWRVIFLVAHRPTPVPTIPMTNAVKMEMGAPPF